MPGKWDTNMALDATDSNEFRARVWTIWRRDYFPSASLARTRIRISEFVGAEVGLSVRSERGCPNGRGWQYSQRIFFNSGRFRNYRDDLFRNLEPSTAGADLSSAVSQERSGVDSLCASSRCTWRLRSYLIGMVPGASARSFRRNLPWPAYFCVCRKRRIRGTRAAWQVLPQCFRRVSKRNWRS